MAYERHGRTRTWVWKAWVRMKDRCEAKPGSPSYENYAGRGIGYDPRWKDFINFLEDMGEAKKPLSLGRIDNNKGYSKDNCRWETRKQQNNNRRVFHHSTTGISGVTAVGRQHFRTRVYCEGIRTDLYFGMNFFEACCARKSWEVNHRGQ